MKAIIACKVWCVYVKGHMMQRSDMHPCAVLTLSSWSEDWNEGQYTWQNKSFNCYNLCWVKTVSTLTLFIVWCKPFPLWDVGYQSIKDCFAYINIWLKKHINDHSKIMKKVFLQKWTSEDNNRMFYCLNSRLHAKHQTMKSVFSEQSWKTNLRSNQLSVPRLEIW